jgi:hypothetical protein
VNVDLILDTLNRHQVAYLLIGGMNFLLRHAPVLTYDVDVWIEDEAANREHCEQALAELAAEWGPTNAQWRPVSQNPPGWTASQALFCLTSPHGSIDVFRSVKGLESWAACRTRAVMAKTATGVPYFALSDEDLLRCQMVLPEGEQKLDRIRVLKQAIEKGER